MIVSPIPVNDADRLATLRALNILDTPPEERFDRIARLASRTFNTPIAYIALIDADRQWFKAKCGLKSDQTGRDESFCGHTIMHQGPLIVPDARRDPRFHDNPLVLGEPFIRFYAGYPLAGPQGHNIGTLCIASKVSRTLEPRELEIFSELARIAEHELNMIDVIRAQRELIDTKNRLAAAQRKLAEELEEAATFVRSLLPERLAGPIRTDWRFVTSSKLGGDFFGYHWLDQRRLAIYLLDVCGHGVAAALLSVSVHNALRRQTLGETRFDCPSEVLASLNHAFPMDQNGNKFFTIWYGVYDTGERKLEYCSAGHPPAIALNGHGGPVEVGSPGLIIGMTEDVEYETQSRAIQPGERLYVFSDGVFEVEKPGGKMLEQAGLVELLARNVRAPDSRVERVLKDIQGYHGGEAFSDDFSILEVEFT